MLIDYLTYKALQIYDLGDQKNYAVYIVKYHDPFFTSAIF